MEIMECMSRNITDKCDNVNVSRTRHTKKTYSQLRIIRLVVR